MEISTYRKYSEELSVDIDNGLEDSDEFKSLTADLEECQKMTDYIVESLAQLDDSIRVFKEDFKNAAKDSWSGAKESFSDMMNGEKKEELYRNSGILSEKLQQL